MYILCVYYSRTGSTEKLMKEISQSLKCECVRLDDGVDRTGKMGWLRSGMQAMARQIPVIKELKTVLPLSAYDLIIIGTPVWAGRCSSPVRSFLQRYGSQIRRAAYVITRGSDIQYKEVYDQMDLYITEPHIAAVSIRPNTAGAEFWRGEFLTTIRDIGKGR